MKLQLNESTLNAYINEAIQQELNENYRVNFEKLGEPELQVIKNHKAARRRLERGAYNRMSLISTRKLRKVLNDMGYSDDQIRAGLNNGAIEVGNGVDNSFRPYQNIYRQNRKDARLRSRMNMPIADNGQNSQEKQENQAEAWDGSFPWDNTDPAWTPRPTRRPQPAPIQTPEPAQPETPARPEMPKLEPVALPAGLVQTGVTLPADQQPGIIGRPQTQPTFAQNAVGTMVKTAMANPADVSQREKNNGLRTIKRNAVRTINSDSYTGDKKADTKLVKDMYRTIRRGDQHPTL